jgi:hypothetical protein
MPGILEHFHAPTSFTRATHASQTSLLAFPAVGRKFQSRDRPSNAVESLNCDSLSGEKSKEKREASAGVEPAMADLQSAALATWPRRLVESAEKTPVGWKQWKGQIALHPVIPAICCYRTGSVFEGQVVWGIC